MESLISNSPNTVGKPVKKIALLDIVQADRKISLWPTYEQIASIALKHFEGTNPTYRPEIVFYNKVYQEDPRIPAIKIKQASEDGCLMGIGFTWSTAAGVAADQAEESKFPFMSPTAVLDKVHYGSYSISLGVSVRKAAKSLKGFIFSKDIQEVVTVFDPANIQEREYAEYLQDALRETNVRTSSVEYNTQDKLYPPELDKKLNKNTLVFLPGYTELRYLVAEIHKKNPGLVFMVGPQWSHDDKPLIGVFNRSDIDLYCLSDVISTKLERPAAQFVAKESEKLGEVSRGVFKYSLFDAIVYALYVLDSEDVQTKEDSLRRMKNLGDHPFSSKAPMYVEGGDVKKEIYLMKWKDSQFLEELYMNPTISSY